jgi:hypothetical protein
MIEKFLRWALSKFDNTPEVKEEKSDAWPFPVVLGTPPACAKPCEKKPAKKRGRPALEKATTRVVKKKTAKKVK